MNIILNNFLSERNQTQKATCCMIPFIKNIHNRQINGDKSRLIVVRGWGGVNDSNCLMGMGFPWGDEKILEMMVVIVYNTVDVLNIPELYTLNRL